MDVRGTRLKCSMNFRHALVSYLPLQALDIAYGYTADGGKTFPFRGKGINLMPILDEVLNHFPDRSFLIHIKRDDENEGIQLATHLKKLPAKRLDQLTVYGGDKPITAIKERTNNVKSNHEKGSSYLYCLRVDWLHTFKPEAWRVTYTRQRLIMLKFHIPINTPDFHYV